MKDKAMEKTKWKPKGKDSNKSSFKSNGKPGFKDSGKPGFRGKGKFAGKPKEEERVNTPSYVLRKIEECISVSGSAKQSKIMMDKLYEATKYMFELQALEKKGIYNAKPKAKDYISSFVNKKNQLLMEGIERAFQDGESKEKILQNDKFFNDEVRQFLEKL